MAKAKTAWGIDVGQCALKAIKLGTVEGEVQVEAFDIIEHPKILSEQDADKDQLIRNALEQFLARNSVAGSTVIISVPGQASFTRFVKLPPVEPKKIPEIVRFEAEQQIPFPINDVIWRWQTFHDPDSPDIELGLFAMKREDVGSALGHFDSVDMTVDAVQMAPLALYNFMVFDEQRDADGATLLVDVGTDQSDLIVADGTKIWTRSIQIGGNNFTEALVRTFKLSFAKAEKLKRSAATSKYARQIFQAMRPVFSDLVQEIQRSVGYYTSLHREVKFKHLVGLGNGFRLPGLQKYVEQNLNIPVVRVNSFNRLRQSPSINAPMFTENVLSFAVAYGLALQGLEQTQIVTNLLPTVMLRRRQWARKRPWFAAAAATVVLALAGPAYRSFADRSALRGGARLHAQNTAILTDLTKLHKQYNNLKDKGGLERKQIDQALGLFDRRNFWPSVEVMISNSIARVATDLRLVAQGAEGRKILAAKPREARMVIYLEKMESTFAESLAPAKRKRVAAKPGPTKKGKSNEMPRTDSAPRRGFIIRVTARTPLSMSVAISRMLDPLRNEIDRIAETMSAFELVSWDYEFTKVTARPAARARSMLTRVGADEGEDGAPPPPPDTQFVMIWQVAVPQEVEKDPRESTARRAGKRGE